MKVTLTKQMYDTLVESCRGLPSERPIAIKTNVFRALLRQINRPALEDGTDDVVETDDLPAAASSPPKK